MTREQARLPAVVVNSMRGRWIAAGTLLSDPFPCRCQSSQGCKQIRNRYHCPCWDARIHDGLPNYCCARKPKHPNQLET